MGIENMKCVMIINEELPLGIIANTSGILGVTLGKYIDEVIGEDVTDKSGKKHLGIIQIPMPILKANDQKLKEIRHQLYEDKFSELVVVDFSDVAQSCHVYDQFIEKMKCNEESELIYFGVAIYGNKKLVNKLAGSLPLLR